MKKWACYLLAVLALVFITQSSELSAGDPPHNEDNGIVCADCHGQSLTLIDLSGTKVDHPLWDTGISSDEAYNAVCLRCHNGVYAPLANSHAPSSAGLIRCTTCHHNHYQEQLDIGTYNQNNFFIARGTGTATAAAFDGTYTTISYTAFSATDPESDWGKAPQPDNLEKLAAKTNNEGQATGGRGAMLVPRVSWSQSRWPSFSIESIDTATQKIVVRGNVSSSAEAKARVADFGIYYGQQVRGIMETTTGVYTYVELYGNEGTYGLANGTGTGVCEVCHDPASPTAPKYYRSDGSGASHNVGTNCSDCHQHNVLPDDGGGFTPSTVHSTFITDDNKTGDSGTKCSGCHTGYDTSPESAHSSCGVCHDAIPDLFDSSFPTYDGQPDDDGDSMFANLTDAAAAPYTQYTYPNGNGRLEAPGSLLISDVGFPPVRCGECHKAKPGALAAAIHGGHAANHFTWNSNCDDCHSASPGSPTESVVIDIHANNCDLCHTGGTYDATTNGVGAVAAANNGIDGDATGAEGDAGTWTKGCTDCHAVGVGTVDALSIGGIHHDNATITVTDGLTDDGTTCATCHSKINHYGNHLARVANEGSCDQCHAATSGTATGIDIDSADAQKHDFCGTCHLIDTDDLVKLVAATNNKGVTTMNDSTPLVTNDGGGTCSQCHTAYGFTDHAHTHNVNTAPNCITGGCHDSGGTGNALPATTKPFSGAGEVHGTQGCATCHETGTDNTVKAVGTNGGAGGTCENCHGSDFATVHTASDTATDHVTISKVTLATGCDNCHAATLSDYNPSKGASPELDTKVHDDCATCHQASGALVAAGGLTTAMGAGSCTTCHGTGYFITHTHSHTGVTTAAPCSSCHTGDAITATDAGQAPGQGTHQNDCSNCHSTTLDATLGDRGVGANGYGDSTTGGTCLTCHGGAPYNYFDGHEHADAGAPEHTFGKTNGTTKQTCDTSGCHVTTTTPYVGATEVHNTTSSGNGCAACHDLDGTPTGALKGSALGKAAATECISCHTGKFDNHSTHGAAHDVTMRTSGTIDEVTATSQACNECHGNFANTWAGIKALHTGGCADCHDSSRATNLSGTYADVQEIIQTDAITIGCLDCHTDRAAVHMDHLTNDQDTNTFGAILESSQCTSCHKGGGTPGSLTDANMMAIHNVSGGGCGTCHVSATGGGVLRDYSGSGGNIGENVNYETLAPYGAGSEGHGGTCVGCHSSYGTSFKAGHKNEDHVNRALDTDMLAGTSNCTTTCHSAADAAAIASTLHSTCNKCHTDDVTDGTLLDILDTAGGNGDADSHTINSQSTCASCHGDYNTNYQTAHDVGDHSGLGSTAKCAGCHIGNILTDVRTHGDGTTAACTLCHTNNAADGTLLDGTTGGTRGVYSAGDATVAAGADSIRECAECHSTYAGSFNAHQRLTDHDGIGSTASCVSCHTGNVITSLLTHKNACAWCHVAALGNDGTLRDGTGAGTPGDTTSVGDATGHDITVTSTCTDCHDVTGNNYATNFSTAHDVKDHDGVVAGGNCTTNCHTGDIVNITATADVHQDTCTNCHTNITDNGALKVGPNANGTAAGGSGSCVECHGTPYDYDTLFGTKHDVRDHNGVTSTPSCITAGCHTGDIVNTTATADIHKDTCTNCHTNETTNGYFRAGTRGDATGGSGNCASCHTDHNSDWYFHQLDHTPAGFSYVLVNSASGTNTVNCVGCHTGDVITAVHDRASAGGTAPCQKCHDAAGALKGSAVAGGGECIDCHGAYFDGHGHHNGGSNQVAYAAGTDRSQELNAASTACAECHQDKTGDNTSFATWDGVRMEHDIWDGAKDATGGCTTCHDYTTNGEKTGDADTPLASTVATVIGTDATANCATCHVPKLWSTGASSTHGNPHPANDFGWDGNCNLCHGGLNVVANIHKNTCTTCHSSAAANRDNEKVGDAANGIDGDATQADGTAAAGDWALQVCSTCHSTATYDLSTVHHTSQEWTTNGSCTNCHAPFTSVAGNHSALVDAGATSCDTCHTATAGQIFTVPDPDQYNMPVSSVNDKVHDACTTCHNVDDDATLKDLATADTHDPDWITDMPDGGVGSTNGGGVCTDCHGAFFVNHSHHTLASNLVVTDTDCATCHDGSAGGTARDAINSPYVAAAEVHNTTGGGDGCAACHNTTTGAKISLAGSADPTTSGTATDYTCLDCHTTGWATLHSPLSGTTIDHNTSLVTNNTACSGCHNAGSTNGLKAVTGPFNTANEVHGGATTNTAGDCLTCHTGAATGAIYTGGSVPANGSGLAAGGGSCVTCHGVFSAAHSHTHTGVTAAASCATATCHDTTGSGGIARAADATPFIGAGEVHATGTCANCHDGTTNALKIGSNGKGDATVNAGAGGDCIACHINGNAYTEWTDIHDAKATTNHASHVTGNAACTSCHDAVGTTDARATSAIPFIAAGDVHNTTAGGNGCAACHTGANDGGLKTPTNVETIVSGDCLDCHIGTATWTTIHTGSDTVDHSAEVANLATCTSSCHTATGNIGLGNIASLISAADDKIHDTCGTCHNANGTVATVTATGGSGTIDVIAANGGDCAACHDTWAFADHGHHGTASNQVSFSSTVDRSQNNDIPANACDQCHTPTGGLSTWTGIYNEHSAACDTCHDYATNGNQTGDPDTPLLATVQAVIGTDATANCVTCHVPKDHASGASSVHGGHDTPDTYVTSYAVCTNCHDSQADRNYVSSIHGRRWASFNPPLTSNCQVCHTSATGGGALHDYSAATGVIMSADNVDYPTAVGVDNTATCVECHNDASGGPATLNQVDDFDGLANGQTAGSTFGNWAEQAGSDGKLPWMVWTGSTATGSTGPSDDMTGGQDYLVLESSPTSGGGGGSVTIEDPWTNVGTNATSPYTVAYSTQASAELLVVAVNIESNGTASAVSSVTYAGSTVNQTTVSSSAGITIWVGSLDISAVADSGNIIVTASNANDIHVHAITFSGADMAGTPVTALSALSPNNKATSIIVPTMTYAAGDQVVTVGQKAAFTSQFTGVNNEDSNYTDGTLLAGSAGASIHSTRGVTTAGTNDGVTDPALVYEQTAGSGGNKSWMSAAGIVVKAGGGGGDSDPTNGVDVTTGSSQYIESNAIDTSAYTTSLDFSFDYNMNIGDNDGTGGLYVQAWDGSQWQPGTPITVNTADTGDAWANSGAINLLAYSNANFKVRIEYVVGSGTIEFNDVAVDNLTISGSGPGAGPTNYHPVPAHTKTITAANCDGCHTGAIITGLHKASTGSVSAPGDFATKTECYKCHASATAAVVTAIYNGKDGANQDCTICHATINTAYSNHTADTHGTALAAPADSTIQSDDCDDCHAGDIQTVVHNVSKTCDNCHANLTNNGELVGVALANHTIGGTSTCLTCHGANYFMNTATHSSNTHSVAVDGDQSAGTACDNAACHNTQASSWSGILARHDQSATTGDACQVCHDSTRTANTLANAGVQTIITDNIRTANIVSCLDCHTDKSASHGGHLDSHFGWNAAVDTCDDCHSSTPGTPTEAVVSNIHGGNCDLCHTGGTYVAATAGIGAAAAADAGIDGDANLASGAAPGFAPATYYCTTCHTTAGLVDAGSVGGIHHNTTAGVVSFASSANCTTAACHGIATSNHNDHSAHVADTGPICVNCHTGAKGLTTGMPIASANGLWHDECSTCHQFGGTWDGLLITAPGTKGVTAMGSGECNGCHTWTWTNLHDDNTNNVDHSQEVASTASCTTCHTATAAGGAGTVANLINGTDAKVHDACSSCHNANGTIATVTASGGSNTIDNLAGASNTCATCHDNWVFGSHGHTHTTAYDPSAGNDRSQDTADDPCQSCHGSGAGPYSLGNWSDILYEHDFVDGTQDGSGACTACHDYASRGNQTGGANTPASGTVASVISTGGTSSCISCHTVKDATTGAGSVHGGHSGNFGFDAQCSVCHTGTADVVGNIHNGTCSTCHSGTPSAANADVSGTRGDAGLAASAVPPFSAATCLTCHPTGTYAPATYHHATASATGGTCITCHQPDVGQNLVAGHNARADLQMPANLACNYCHLWWPNEAYTRTGGAGTPINIYNLSWDPNNSPNTNAGATALPTHAISTAAIPISDYAACFACHGKSSFTGSAGTSTQVFPFHGYGADGNEVFTGDNTCFAAATGCGGKTSDLINIYGAPTVTGYGSGTSHLATKGRHPGFNSLNLLEPFVSMVQSGANPGKNREYGTSSSYKQPHKADAGAYETPALTGTATFNVPWDNYAATWSTAAGSVDIDTEYDHVNHTDTGQTHTVPTVMRTVPLNGSW